MVAEHDRPPGRGLLGDEPAHGVLRLAVEAGVGLVEDREARLAEQRLDEHDLLQRALRERLEPFGHQRAEPQALGQRARAALALRAVQAAQAACRRRYAATENGGGGASRSGP